MALPAMAQALAEVTLTRIDCGSGATPTDVADWDGIAATIVSSGRMKQIAANRKATVIIQDARHQHAASVPGGREVGRNWRRHARITRSTPANDDAPSNKGADDADRRRADSSLECRQPHQPVAPADPRLSERTCPGGDGRQRCRCRHPDAAHTVGSERERALHGGRAGASRPLRDPRQLRAREAGEPRSGRHVEAAPGNARMPLHLHWAGPEQVADGRHRRLAVAGSRAGWPADRDDGGELSAEGGRGRPAAPKAQAYPRSPRAPERGHEPE